MAYTRGVSMFLLTLLDDKKEYEGRIPARNDGGMLMYDNFPRYLLKI